MTEKVGKISDGMCFPKISLELVLNLGFIFPTGPKAQLQKAASLCHPRREDVDGEKQCYSSPPKRGINIIYTQHIYIYTLYMCIYIIYIYDILGLSDISS